MNRLLVIALVASIGSVGGVCRRASSIRSPVGSARARRRGDARRREHATTSRHAGLERSEPSRLGKKARPRFRPEAALLSKSGMGKGKKTLIYIGVGVGFAATAWTIDHNVLDITPSSLGTRQD